MLRFVAYVLAAAALAAGLVTYLLVRALRRPLLALGLAMALAGCVGVQRVPTDGGGAPPAWTSIAQAVIVGAEAIAPVVIAVVSDASIDGAQKAVILSVLRTVQDALQAAQSGLGAYRAMATPGNRCALRTSLDDALSGLVSLDAALRDGGVEVPQTVPAAIGALGPLVDALSGPDCANVAPAPATTMRTRAVLGAW